MLQQFIQRHLRHSSDQAATGATDKAGSLFANLRSADWLLGGSVVTLAVVFVAGLLGLRASTADLQDQARNNTRDLAALKADTVDRINGIAGDLAKTNQTLTDLLALRSGEPGARDAAGEKDGTAKGGEARSGEARGEGRPGVAPARIVPVPPIKPVAKAAKPTGKVEPVGLSPITVRRRPERDRAARRPEPPARPAVAVRAAPRTAAETLRARRDAILRELRLRRLARRDF